MQLVHADLLTKLRAQARDFIVLYELYEPDYDISNGFDPLLALDRFAGQTYQFTYLVQSVTYRREVLHGPSINKTISKQLNSVSIRFSNTDRYMAGFVRNNHVEGMILFVRAVSRSISDPVTDGKSFSAFVGKLGRPDGFDRGEGTFTAKPFIGNIEAQVPPRDFERLCPLKFKGAECLGTETITQKSLAYRNALTCNKTEAQCLEYENEEFRQGINLVQIQSSFVHKSNESFFKKILNILPGISRKKTVVGNSLFNATPFGDPVPLILGRVLKNLIPLQFRDTGETLWFKMAAGRGPIADFVDVRSHNLNFSQPLEVTEHLGEYGNEGTQSADTAFPGTSYLSRLAYITGRVVGSSMEVEDPVPDISSIVAGITVRMYSDVQPSGTGKLESGVGGVTLPGSGSSAPGTPAASYSLAITSRTPVGYYKLDEAAGPAIANTSGAGPSGTYNAAATFHQAGMIETDSPSYSVGNKVGKILAPAGSAMDLVGSITIAGWGVAGNLKTLVCRNGIVGLLRSNYIVFREPGRVHAQLSFAVGVNGQKSFDINVSNVTTTGANTFVVLTRSGSAMRLYVNGCLAGSRDDLPPTEDLDYSFWDGYDGDNASWKIGFDGPAATIGEGDIATRTAQVAWFDYAWTASDVADAWASAETDPQGCPGTDWTDNPVDHTRYFLTEPGILNLPEGYVDDYLSAYAAAYNTGAVKDETNAERCLLPNTENQNMGIVYKRYTSTGLLGPRSFESSRAQVPAGIFDREVGGVSSLSYPRYEVFDPASPPTSLTVVNQYRKRYTGNLEFRTKEKVLDALYDRLFPCFRGFLKWNARGQVVIDSERPADHTFLRAAAVPTDTTIQVNDVLPWKNRLGSPYLLEGKIRIGVPWRPKDDPARSEVRSITTATYSSAGNSITLASSASGGPVATASGANLTGGSTTVQASGTVTITGTLADGSSITVTIDGIACVLNLTVGENSSTIGLRVAAAINAEPTLRTYIEASASTNVVTVRAKVGVLTLSSALEENHYTEIADPVTAPTLASSAGALGAGTYLIAYAYRNPNGLTRISGIASITITASKKIDVTGLGSLPAGVLSVDWFISRSANSTSLGFIANNDGSAFSINSLPLTNAERAPVINFTGEEVLRGMMSFAGRALTYADTTRANILDGTFTWPEGASRSEINQIKLKHLEAIQDFAEQPFTVNDTPHQEDIRKTNTQDLDLTSVDNYNQAARLGNGYLNTLRDGDFFFRWGGIGEALLLEEGDVVFASDDSGPFRNVPVRLKTLQISKFPEITLAGRLYASIHYGDLIANLAEGEGGTGAQAGMFLPSAISTFDTPPDILFNETDFPPDGLVQATDGTAGITSIRGGAIFGPSSFGQFARVRLIKRAGVTVDEMINPNLRPNDDLEATFEFLASAEGLYTVELEVCNNRNQCSLTKPTASIIIGFGTTFGIATEGGTLITTESGIFIEQEH